MFKRISAFLLKIWGWKLTGVYPKDIPKLIICVAPHTANLDFPVGLLVRSAWQIKANFVAKHTLFRWPLGYIFRALGGIPVNRSRSANFVESIVEAFRREEHMHLVIAPEGTRKKVERFKTGFYHIARLANIPIVLCSFDWVKKTIHFNPELFYPSGDEKADMAQLWNYYKNFQGYYPLQGVGGNGHE